MLYPSPAQDRQPSGPTPLLRELQQYCPGYFSGSEFGMFGHRRAPLEGSIGVRVTHGIAGYAGNGTTNCAVVPWQGINLNTRPEMTWVLVYKKNATGILNGAIAGLGATGGSSGNTLFLITGEATANSIRFQAKDSSGTTYSNTVSSDFGADDQRYHCVVVSGAARSVDDGGGFQYYADGKKLNFSPSEIQSGNPTSTLFNLATLLCARRGGAISGANGSNYDVALFVPMFGIRQPDWWCQEISRNPWQLFESERRIWMPEFVAGGTSPVTSDLGVSYTIRARAESDLAAAFAIRQTAQADLEASFSIRGAAERDLAASYAVLGSAQASLSAAYEIRGAAQADLGATYSVLGSAQQDLAASYAIRASAQASLLGEYAVRGSVQSDFSAAYTVENAGVVLSDFSAAYAVLGSAQRDLSGNYSVQQSVSADLGASFVVRGSAQSSLAGTYDVLGQVASDLTASWTITGSVARNFAGSYVIQGSGGGADPGAVWGYLLSNGLTAEQTILKMAQQIDELHRIHGLQIAFPLQTTDTSRSAGDISQSVGDDGTTTRVQRL